VLAVPIVVTCVLAAVLAVDLIPVAQSTHILVTLYSAHNLYSTLDVSVRACTDSRSSGSSEEATYIDVMPY
jgi:hypothetical protein